MWWLGTPATARWNEGVTEPSLTCQVCGRIPDATEPDPTLTWALDTDGDRRSWTCPGCVRDNVRAMEAKLEPEWW